MQLAPQVSQLATGEITASQFANVTSPAAINQGLASQPLPGQLVPTGKHSLPSLCASSEAVEQHADLTALSFLQQS